LISLALQLALSSIEKHTQHFRREFSRLSCRNQFCCLN
jgi:hypothetical protein